MKNLRQSLEDGVRKSAAVVEDQEKWKRQKGSVLRIKDMQKWAGEEHKEAVSALLRGDAPPEL